MTHTYVTPWVCAITGNSSQSISFRFNVIVKKGGHRDVSCFNLIGLFCSRGTIPTILLAGVHHNPNRRFLLLMFETLKSVGHKPVVD